MTEKKTKGMVWLVGAGPGDPELLTIKGKVLLSMAEVLVYDRLASSFFLKDVPAGCEKIYVGKAPGRHSMKQEEINAVLVQKALEGKKIVRLKGGDPFVFGRGGEEILALEQHGIPYEVVPGVTSAVAAPADAGIPVTHRGMSQSFHVITGHTAEEPGIAEKKSDTLTGNYEEFAKLPGTLVFLMGLSNLETIVSRLIENGKSPDTPSAVVCNGTLPAMRCVRASLGMLPSVVRSVGLQAPGIIVVGETAACEMTSRKSGLMSGITIGVTGTEQMAEKLSAGFRALGAEVVRAGRLQVVSQNKDLFAAALRKLPAYDWIVFTSRNGVEQFFSALRETETDLRALGHIKFAVVGRGTGDYLKACGIHADYMPKVYTTEALAQGLADLLRQTGSGRDLLRQIDHGKQAASGKCQKKPPYVLIPRARQGAKKLTEILKASGAVCDDLPVYDVIPETSELTQTDLARLDYLTFESSSGVRAFMEQSQKSGIKIPDTVVFVCIGNATAKTLTGYGVQMKNILTAEDYTADGMIEALLCDLGRRQ